MIKQLNLIVRQISDFNIQVGFVPREFQIADELASPRQPVMLQKLMQPGTGHVGQGFPAAWSHLVGLCHDRSG